MAIEHFFQDDAGYTRWLELHPDSFVLHLRRGNRLPMLHTSRCTHLYPESPEYGLATVTPKLCDTDRQQLEDWVRHEGRQYVPCSSCDV